MSGEKIHQGTGKQKTSSFETTPKKETPLNKDKQNKQPGVRPKNIAKKKPGPPVRLHRNTQLWHQESQIGKARVAGDTEEVARLQMLLARSVVPKDKLVGESDLLQHVFVPYRYMSAYERTQEFARTYARMYREYYLRHYGREPYMATRRLLSSWYPGEINCLWQARQEADLMGIPYTLYLRIAFKATLEEIGYQQNPTPNQLLQPRVVKAIREANKRSGDLAAVKAYEPSRLNPMFLAENYIGDPIQIAAHDDLEARIKRHSDYFKLGVVMLQDKIMPEHVARARFGDERVDRTIAEFQPSDPRVADGSKSAPSIPVLGCFLNYRDASPVCQGCAVKAQCQVQSDGITENLMRRYGTDDPWKAKRRSDATERKRRQRERDKRAAEAGLKPCPEDGATKAE